MPLLHSTRYGLRACVRSACLSLTPVQIHRRSIFGLTEILGVIANVPSLSIFILLYTNLLIARNIFVYSPLKRFAP
jgi:hypothetical protein